MLHLPYSNSTYESDIALLLLSAPPGISPFEEWFLYDRTFTIGEFVTLVNANKLTDNNGYGYWACGPLKYAVDHSAKTVKPSRIIAGETNPQWATHVLWCDNLPF